MLAKADGFQMDQKIQTTISTAFPGVTILCIAHRLRTIIGYDKVCVMEAGHVMEYDSPLNLFHNTDGFFHALCARSNITEVDIVQASAK